jgi:hypothetical protein
MNDVTDKIKRRIRAKQRGWVFTPKDFLDLGSRAAVDQVLSRLVRQGVIRRLDRGVYDFPKQHPDLGVLTPPADDLARVLAGRSGDIVFPSGAMAANLLGFSTQIPAKPAYLTNGVSRTRTLSGRTIRLQHARIPIVSQLSPKANLALQALAYLGKHAMDDTVLSQCARQLDAGDLKKLQSLARQLPGWLSDTVLKIQKLKSIGDNAPKRAV